MNNTPAHPTPGSGQSNSDPTTVIPAQSQRATPRVVPAPTAAATPAGDDTPTTVFTNPGATAATTPGERTTVIPAVGETTTGTAYGHNPAVTAVPVVGAGDLEEVDVVDGRRGTMDFGLFILRLIFGALLIYRSASILFNLGGAGGLDAMEHSFSGYAYPQALAIGVTGIQLAAGVFLVLGLLTPFAAAFSVVGTSFFALHAIHMSDHTTNPLYWEDSIWLSIILVVIAVTLQFTGPGRISADVARSWAKRPLVSSWLFFLAGCAGGAALWWFGAGVSL